MRASDRTRLHQLVTEYSELQYPDDDVRDALSDAEAEQRASLARSRAMWIADLVIETGLYRDDAHTDTPDDSPADTDGM